MAANLDDRRLQRSRVDRVLFGVCGGLGHYFDIDPVIVRLAFILITLAGGAGIVAYIILAIVLPEEGTAAPGGQPALRYNLEHLRDEAQQMVSPGDESRPRRGKEWGGLILIGLGLLFLVGNLGWFVWLRWDILWPLLLVSLGLAILLRRNQ